MDIVDNGFGSMASKRIFSEMDENQLFTACDENICYDLVSLLRTYIRAFILIDMYSLC